MSAAQNRPNPNPLEDPNKHLMAALKIYSDNGIYFGDVLEWHLMNGVVHSTTDVFALGFACALSDPMTALPMEDKNADCLHFTMVVGNMFDAVIGFADRFDFLAFRRDTKSDSRIRFYDYGKFMMKIA
jgi:hypothetical protein